MAEWLQNYIGGVCATDHSISEGGYAQKITVLHRGRVSRDSKRWLRNLYTTPEWCLLTIDFLLLIILNSFFATSFLTHIWLGYPIKGWWIYWKVCKPWKICKICQRYKRQTKPISPCFIFFQMKWVSALTLDSLWWNSQLSQNIIAHILNLLTMIAFNILIPCWFLTESDQSYSLVLAAQTPHCSALTELHGSFC